MPAWPMPIHQTKLTMSQPHITGMAEAPHADAGGDQVGDHREAAAHHEEADDERGPPPLRRLALGDAGHARRRSSRATGCSATSGTRSSSGGGPAHGTCRISRRRPSVRSFLLGRAAAGPACRRAGAPRRGSCMRCRRASRNSCVLSGIVVVVRHRRDSDCARAPGKSRAAWCRGNRAPCKSRSCALSLRHLALRVLHVAERDRLRRAGLLAGGLDRRRPGPRRRPRRRP